VCPICKTETDCGDHLLVAGVESGQKEPEVEVRVGDSLAEDVWASGGATWAQAVEASNSRRDLAVDRSRCHQRDLSSPTNIIINIIIAHLQPVVLCQSMFTGTEDCRRVLVGLTLLGVLFFSRIPFLLFFDGVGKVIRLLSSRRTLASREAGVSCALARSTDSRCE
jgi:hypothetical protein